MPTTAQCYAAYVKCLGTNPSQSQKVACTFKYIQCILHGAEVVVDKELKRFERGKSVKKPKSAPKEGRSTGRGN